MKEQFTPGTWTLDNSHSIIKKTNDGYYCIAKVQRPTRGSLTLIESKANAALIAAAPELYYAAKDALDLLDRRLGAADGSLYTSEIAKLKAALSKANPNT